MVTVNDIRDGGNEVYIPTHRRTERRILSGLFDKRNVPGLAITVAISVAIATNRTSPHIKASDTRKISFNHNRQSC